MTVTDGPDPGLALPLRQPRALLWLMLATEGLALVLTLALGVEAPFRFFGAVSLAAQTALLATILILYALRRSLARLGPERMAHACLAIAIAVVCMVALTTGYVFEPAVALQGGDWTALIARLVGIVIVVVVLAAAAFHNYWRSRRFAMRTKQAELEALQARIRPHFLFNTLNTAAALVHQRPEVAERLLMDLADLFRAALAGPREIPLADELDLVRRYLEIEQQRFGDRLSVEWSLPGELPDIHVPSLSIQPLVENAIHHGVERVTGKARIEIRISQTDSHVVVHIRNPIAPTPAGPRAHHGVGLSAARARIEAMTGGAGGITTAIDDGHFVTTTRLPRLHRAGGAGLSR